MKFHSDIIVSQTLSVNLFLSIPNCKAVVVVLAVVRILDVNAFVICVEVLPRITDPDFSITDPDFSITDTDFSVTDSGTRGEKKQRIRICNTELTKGLSILNPKNCN
jgi:hypothetical protein